MLCCFDEIKTELLDDFTEQMLFVCYRFSIDLADPCIGVAEIDYFLTLDGGILWTKGFETLSTSEYSVCGRLRILIVGGLLDVN